mmetsp:Transcript_6724/g.13370  ORF Transcript_6724/g.13370 Transcript_6724/m.13370 type:complete len:86 (+) Transcript_6724:19-276(+)
MLNSGKQLVYKKDWKEPLRTVTDQLRFIAEQKPLHAVHRTMRTRVQRHLDSSLACMNCHPMNRRNHHLRSLLGQQQPWLASVSSS